MTAAWVSSKRPLHFVTLDPTRIASIHKITFTTPTRTVQIFLLGADSSSLQFERYPDVDKSSLSKIPCFTETILRDSKNLAQDV